MCSDHLRSTYILVRPDSGSALAGLTYVVRSSLPYHNRDHVGWVSARPDIFLANEHVGGAPCSTRRLVMENGVKLYCLSEADRRHFTLCSFTTDPDKGCTMSIEHYQWLPWLGNAPLVRPGHGPGGV